MEARNEMDADDLVGTLWTFGRLGEAPFCPILVLAPGGLVGGHRHENEAAWQVISNRLAFLNTEGSVSTSFDEVSFVGGKLHEMTGRFRSPASAITHLLRATTHPGSSNQTDTISGARIEFIVRPVRPAKRDLIVLRAGSDSLHTKWRADIEDAFRTWDLCISYYDHDLETLVGPYEWLTHQPFQRKFEAIYDLFHSESPLWSYDRIWLPDDDLLTGWRDINRLFTDSRAHQLHLCQPSLSTAPECHITHPITAQKPDSRLRLSNFVEIMCPLFSREALRICLGSFQRSRTGFGLDHLWPRLLGSPLNSIGILDSVGIIHTRPFAQNYDFDEAMREEAVTHAAYSFTKPQMTEIASLK